MNCSILSSPEYKWWLHMYYPFKCTRTFECCLIHKMNETDNCSLLSAIAMFLYRRRIRRNGSKARAGKCINYRKNTHFYWNKNGLKNQQVCMKPRSLLLLTADNGIRNGRSYVTSTEKTWPDTLYEIMLCLAKLGLIMAYTFLCDR